MGVMQNRAALLFCIRYPQITRIAAEFPVWVIDMWVTGENPVGLEHNRCHLWMVCCGPRLIGLQFKCDILQFSLLGLKLGLVFGIAFRLGLNPGH